MAPKMDVSVLGAVATAAIALALQVLGVDEQTLAAGFVGSIIGNAFAPPMARGRAICVFAAAACASAMVGAAATEVGLHHWPTFRDAATTLRSAAVVLLGIGLHPIVKALVDIIPSGARRISTLLRGNNGPR